MQLPKNAKKVFKGEIFDTYQWPQEMYDGSTETFEMLKRQDTVQIIPTQGDKIFMAKEEQPNIARDYTFFGGRVDEGEDPLDCAKRELMEEAGIESDDWELIKVYEPYHKMDWKIHLYVARGANKVAEQKLDPGEKIAVIEVSFDKMIEIVSTNEKFAAKDIALDILRMKIAGKLDSFKNKLFVK